MCAVMYSYITIAIETGWINCYPSDTENKVVFYFTLYSNLKNILVTKMSSFCFYRFILAG